VTIIATVGNGRLDLSITDDGIGLPIQVPDCNGLGFKTMAYRADLMNGSFSVQSRDGAAGAIVACSIPLLSA
jgi:signal transduction histidine kinase